MVFFFKNRLGDILRGRKKCRCSVEKKRAEMSNHLKLRIPSNEETRPTTHFKLGTHASGGGLQVRVRGKVTRDEGLAAATSKQSSQPLPVGRRGAVAVMWLQECVRGGHGARFSNAAKKALTKCGC